MWTQRKRFQISRSRKTKYNPDAFVRANQPTMNPDFNHIHGNISNSSFFYHFPFFVPLSLNPRDGVGRSMLIATGTTSTSTTNALYHLILFQLGLWNAANTCGIKIRFLGLNTTETTKLFVTLLLPFSD